MNNWKTPISAVPLVLMLFALVLPQKVSLTEDEFNKKYEKALAKLDQAPHRILKMTVSKFGSNAPQRSFEQIEIVPPDRKKRSILSGGFNGKPTFERIWLNSRYFERIGNKSWAEVAEPSSPSSSDKRNIQKKEFSLLERGMLNGEAVEVLEVIEFAAYASDTPVRRSKTSTRYLFDSQGKLLKLVKEMDVGLGVVRYAEESTYQYDPNIKIEAPTK